MTHIPADHREPGGQEFSTGISVRSEGLVDRLHDYVPNEEILAAHLHPGRDALERREVYRAKKPGCDFAVVVTDDGPAIVPAWHDLNTDSKISHGQDYGSGVFEGLSVEPVTENGLVTGANMILFGPRMRRMFGRSLRSRGLELPGTEAEYAQAVVDLMTLQSPGIFDPHNQGVASRAYVRPSVRPSHKAGLGVGTPEHAPVDAVAEGFWWPFYFKNPKEVYEGNGAIVAGFPVQRLEMPRGKTASNYGPMGPITGLAKSELVGAHEAIIFAPFVSNDGAIGEQINLDQMDGLTPKARRDLMARMALADGPGEEIMVVVGNELWFPPLMTNRLGGTTLDHVKDHIAQEVGLTPVERVFSVADLKRELAQGHQVSPAFAGNASRVAPIGRFDLWDAESRGADGRPLPMLHVSERFASNVFPVSDQLRSLVDLYESHVTGKVTSSNPELLTPLALSEGQEARRAFDQMWRNWF